MSGGRYTMSAGNLRFNYLRTSITITDIHFRPVRNDLEEVYMVSADSLILRLDKIIPLLLNREVHVDEIRVVNPAIEVRKNIADKDHLHKSDLNSKIRELQANTMEFLNELRVNSCILKNASFRYYPVPGMNKRYQLRNIDLSIRDFKLPKPGTDSADQTIEGKIRLSIHNPQMEIPDSFRRVQFDFFEWNNENHNVNLGKFMLTQRSFPPRIDSILVQLDTISIRKIDWKIWLDSGIVKLDTIMARNGNMYFESSVKGQKKRRDSLDIRKLKVWDAIGKLQLKYFSARFINVGIVNRLAGQERNNSLVGDSLVIHGLVIRPEAKNPLVVRNLALSVRSYYDQGKNNAFESSFSGLTLKGDTMLLRNYFIRSTKLSRIGAGNTLRIPLLSIKGISLQDLMYKKAKVREIRMDNPELTMYSAMKKTDGNLTISDNTFKEIRPYVDVEKVILNNAMVTVRNRKDTGTVIGTRRFSAVILSKLALAAPDAEGILSSFTDVNMDHFYFITPRIELELYGGRVDYAHKTLHFNQVEGYFNKRQALVNLQDVSIQGSGDLKPFRKGEIWHASKLKVGSGTVDITIEDKQRGPLTEIDRLLAEIDSMSLSNIVIKFHKGDITGSAFLRNMEAEGQQVFISHYQWDRFSGQLEKIRISSRKLNLESSDAEISSYGNSTFRNTAISIDAGNIQYRSKSPSLVIKSESHAFNHGRVFIDYLGMEKPVISLNINEKRKDEEDVDTSTVTFFLKNFLLSDPDIAIGFNSGPEKISFVSSGKEIGGAGLSISKQPGIRRFNLAELRSSLDNTIVQSDSGEIFRTSAIDFDLSEIEHTDHEPIRMGVESFHTGAVMLNRYNKGDTIELHTGDITLGRISKLVLQKDSLLSTAFKIPPVRILPSIFSYRTPEKSISIRHFTVNTEEGYLGWDSLEALSRLTRDSFFSKQPFEKDYITFSTGKLRADDLRPVIYGEDTTVYMRKLTLDPVYLKVERDKRMPDDTVAYRPLLVHMLKKIIPFPAKVDTIQIMRSEITHNLLNEKTGKEGSIFFTDIHGYILNMRTFDYKEHDSIRVSLETRFMGAGYLLFAYREDYTDTLQGFVMGARMGRMDMYELNRLITPLYNVRIDGGIENTLRMRVKGNDRLAYGSMDMNYDDLKVSVLDEENHKKKMSSFLVNILVRTKNNKLGIIYAERLREKSVFNYWSLISLNGLLTNLGVRKNKAQERRFYRSLKKHQLPENIF